MTNIEKAIEKIKEDGITEIIEIAIENFTEGYNSIVFYDPENDSFEGDTWTSGTYLNPESRLEEVFRLDGNWIANNSWEVNDILSDEEYEEFKNVIAKKEGLTDESDIQYAADFLDAKKLKLIGVDFEERLEEYCLFTIEESDIVESLQKSIY